MGPGDRPRHAQLWQAEGYRAVGLAAIVKSCLIFCFVLAVGGCGPAIGDWKCCCIIDASRSYRRAVSASCKREVCECFLVRVIGERCWGLGVQNWRLLCSGLDECCKAVWPSLGINDHRMSLERSAHVVAYSPASSPWYAQALRSTAAAALVP